MFITVLVTYRDHLSTSMRVENCDNHSVEMGALIDYGIDFFLNLELIAENIEGYLILFKRCSN